MGEKDHSDKQLGGEGGLSFVPLASIDAVRRATNDPVARAELLADVCRLNTLYMIMQAGSGDGHLPAPAMCGKRSGQMPAGRSGTVIPPGRGPPRSPDAIVLAATLTPPQDRGHLCPMIARRPHRLHAHGY